MTVGELDEGNQLTFLNSDKYLSNIDFQFYFCGWDCDRVTIDDSIPRLKRFVGRDIILELNIELSLVGYWVLSLVII